MTTLCQHVAEAKTTIFPGTPVHKEECCLCYQSLDTTTHSHHNVYQVSDLMTTKVNYPKTGHNVCLICFSGGCLTPNGHLFRHYEVTKHHVILNTVKIQSTPTTTDSSSTTSTVDPTAVKSLTELAALGLGSDIAGTTQYNYSAYCITCDILHPIDSETTPQLYQSLQAIKSNEDSLKLQEFNDSAVLGGNAGGGFDDQPKECEHVHTLSSTYDEVSAINLSLLVVPGDDNNNSDMNDGCTRTYIPYESKDTTRMNPKLYMNDNILPDLSTAAKPLTDDEKLQCDSKYGTNCYNTYQCQDCSIATNLWMCMSCGYLGCARRDYDGSGGNNHAIEHNKETGHPLVIKIATVTKDKGDIWCYSCEDPALDTKLKEHLEIFSLDTDKLLQTESTLADMQLQLNINAQFASAFNKDGFSKSLIFGQYYTGMENYGNSCYIASVLQLYFRIPNIFQRYYLQGLQHVKTCRNGRPFACILCNMFKLTHGLFSGDYSSLPSSELLLSYIQSIFPNIQLQRSRLTHGNGIKRCNTHMGDDYNNNTATTNNNQQQQNPSNSSMNDGDDEATQCNKKHKDNCPTTTTADDNTMTSAADSSSTTTTTTTPSIQSNIKLQNGITVHSVRKLLNNNHPIFGNMKQQDAHEFFGHLRDYIATFEKDKCPQASKIDLTTTPAINDALGYKTQQLIHCTACDDMTYKYSNQYDFGLELVDHAKVHIPQQTIIHTTDNKDDDETQGKNLPPYDITKCIPHYSTKTELIGFRCPTCQTISKCTSTTTLFTLPTYLTVQVKRFVVDTKTWSLSKNNAPLLGTNEIDISSILTPIAPDLTVIANKQANGGKPITTSSSDDDKYQTNVDNIVELCQVPPCLALKALKQCGNNPDSAVEAIFSSDSMDHVVGCSCNGVAAVVQPQSTQVIDPITITTGQLDKSIFNHTTRQLNNVGTKYKLIGFINHLGTTPSNGHYVSHIRSSFNTSLATQQEQFNPTMVVQKPTVFTTLNYTGDDVPQTTSQIQECLSQLDTTVNDPWICYNDGKVFINDEPPNDQAYVLLYQRVD